ncbi:MAG: glycosyltransferase [Candidatus Omnitrophica bacterium]|nr:glycosyltransferase [Candidatus Omnitrophota bacterium]
MLRHAAEKVSVVMPAFNEERRISDSITETARTLKAFGCPWEIIIIDDGSGDRTYETARFSAEQYKGQVIVRRNRRNIGKGRALKKAFRYVSGAYVVFLDADLDLHPMQIQTLFDIMRLDNADIVIGSKMHPNSRVHYPLQRKIISSGYYLCVKALFGLPCHDTQTGLKLFKAEVLRAVFPRILVKKFAFDLEVLVNAYHLGFKIAEAPIVIDYQKPYGLIGPRAIWVTFMDTLAIFYRMYVLKYYDRIDYHRRKNMAKQFRRMRR